MAMKAMTVSNWIIVPITIGNLKLSNQYLIFPVSSLNKRCVIFLGVSNLWQATTRYAHWPFKALGNWVEENRYCLCYMLMGMFSQL